MIIITINVLDELGSNEARNNYENPSGICQHSRCTHRFSVTTWNLLECKLYEDRDLSLICSLIYPRYLKQRLVYNRCSKIFVE